MAYTWNLTLPADSDNASLGAGQIRADKTTLKSVLEEEHDAVTVSGSHKIPSGNTAARPTTNLVTGRMYFNTQLGRLERYDGAAWVDANPFKITASATGQFLQIHPASFGGGILTGQTFQYTLTFGTAYAAAPKLWASVDGIGIPADPNIRADVTVAFTSITATSVVVHVSNNSGATFTGNVQIFSLGA